MNIARKRGRNMKKRPGGGRFFLALAAGRFCVLWKGGGASGSGGFLCRVELFHLLRVAGPFCVGWNCSVRFGPRCASIVTGERDRVGGARRRAPNTPGSPCHPRRSAVPSAYHVRLRVGRDTASCLSRPLTASMPSAPASRARLGECDGVQHPRGTFRLLMGLGCRYAYEKK